MTAARGVTGAAITVPGPTSVGSREASLGALRIGTCFRLGGVVPVVRAAFPNISGHVVDSKRVRKFCAHLCRADKVVVCPLYSPFIPAHLLDLYGSPLKMVTHTPGKRPEFVHEG